MIGGILIVLVLIGIIILISPCIIKSIFKLKDCQGYCSGICNWVLTSFLIFIGTVIFFAVVMKNLLKETNQIIQTNQIPMNNNLNVLLRHIFYLIILVLIIWIIHFLLHVFFIKGIAKEENKNGVILMYISGYFFCGGCSLVSLAYEFIWINFILKQTEITYPKISDPYIQQILMGFIIPIILAGIIVLLLLVNFIMLNIGIIICIFFYFKKKNIILLLIALGIEFKDIFISILYIYHFQNIFVIILQILMPLISLAIGVYIYIHYDSNDSIDEGEYKTLELNLPNTNAETKV